jgi:hypothetical protein
MVVFTVSESRTVLASGSLSVFTIQRSTPHEPLQIGSAALATLSAPVNHAFTPL